MIDFERSEAGLLIPEQPVPRTKEPNRLAVLVNSVGLGTIVNLMMVLIQLFTVWILWITYQDTVIPNRQKELLSEQVAQLELERVTRTKEVAAAKRRVERLNAELVERHAELQTLSTERQSLLKEATTAQTRAERARLAEAAARVSANTAQSGLEASQWSIYYQNASVVLGLPHLIMIRKLGEIERAGIGASDPKAAFHTYLERVEKIWPNMEIDAKFVTSELRKDSTSFYPSWMKEEFATYFAKEANGLSCPKPDFDEIKADTDKKFDAAATAAIAAERKEQADRQTAVDEAMNRRVRIPYSESMKDHEVRVAVSNATYKMIDAVEKRMRETIVKCNEQFDPIGDKFFTSKGVSQPTIPDSVFEEFRK